MASKHLKFAVSAALIAAAGPALALDSTSFSAVNPALVTNNDVTNNPAALTVSGATATDRSFIDILLDATGGLCSGNSDGSTAAADIAEVYTTEANLILLPTTATYTSSLTQNYAVACKAKNPIGTLAAGTPFSVTKFSSGSGNGINEVATGVVLASATSRGRRWVDVAACRTTTPVLVAGNVATGSGTGSRVDINLYVNCPTNLTGFVPKAGLSDVEPALLSGGNPFFAVPGGPSAVNVANVTASQGVGVAFAPIVSRPFFIALQKAQGLDAAPTNCTIDGAAANTTEACMPTISSGVLRGIYAGNVALVAQLANAAGAAINTAGVIGTLTTSQTQLYVCRRETASGTQVSHQSFYLGQGCIKTSRTFVAPGNSTSGEAWTSSTVTTARVWAGNGASEAKACMDARSANNQWAVGIISTENPMGNGNDDWRYVKIDGVAPSLENIVKGKWAFFSENTVNTPATTANQLGQAQTDIVNALKTSLRTAAVLATSNTAHPFGTGGLLAIPATKAAAWTPASAPVSTTPVNSMAKSLTYGGSGDNCTPAADLQTAAAPAGLVPITP